MNLKKIGLLLVFTMVFSLFFVSTSMAVTVLDENIPEEWFSAPKTASEMGITEYNQSPILDERVARGELPAVEERLPEDPPVIVPYEKVGKYGGTVHLWDTLNNNIEIGFWRHEAIALPTPKGNVVPEFVKSWEFSNNRKDLTLKFYKGVKWSDGHPFTAEDIMFYWEHEAQNEDYHPVPPQDWNPPLLDVTSEDKYTVTFHYGTPVPNRLYSWTFMASLVAWTKPCAHFAKNYHPDFVPEDELNKIIEDAGYDAWNSFYEYLMQDSWTRENPDLPVRPSLGAYILTERTQTRQVYERNPYFPFVDTEGNQLPYIDRIVVHLANSPEMADTKAVTGEATVGARHVQTSNIPIYKKNEEKEDFRTLIFHKAYGAEVGLQPNLTHPEPRMRAIMQNKKFRQALSLAIDRDNINEKVYFGLAVPRQATILPTSEYFKEEYAEAYADYNPQKAKELLNEIGMVDTNGDGLREGPDGKPFNLQLVYCKVGPIDPTNVLELVSTNFADIGIDFQLKMISRELHDTMWSGNEGKDMSVWTLDGIIGNNLLTAAGLRMFAPLTDPEFVQYPGWVNWYNSSAGEDGVEPPQEIKDLIEAAEIVQSTDDPAERERAITKLLESQAENVRMIGTVGMGPQPIIVKNKLKNVPETGLWDAKLQYLSAYHPEQFYIEE